MTNFRCKYKDKNGQCGEYAIREGLCNIHWHWKEWLDNSDPDNLGIIKFGKAVVPEWLRNEVPEFHKRAYYEFFQLYSPSKRDKMDRLLAEISYREAGKTTRFKLLLLYVCCFGLERFVAYCSETATFAESDTQDVKTELATNRVIRQYFGKISSREVFGQEGEWNKKLFKTTTGVYVLPRGVGQQIRSALKSGWRITLCLVNDMYSKDSVKTETGRKSYKEWFFNDLFKALDSVDGKFYFNGTILHEDTVPVFLMESSSWKTLVTPIMDVNDFYKALKYCKETESTIMLPTREECAEIVKRENLKLSWPERYDLYYILKQYRGAYETHEVEGFFQELFHILVRPDKSMKEYVVQYPMTLFYEKGHNFVQIDYGDKVITREVNVFLGVDPATALTTDSKFSSICIIGMDKDRKIYVFGYSRGKYGFRDEFHPFYVHPNSDFICDNYSVIKRIGIVDEVLRLARTYRAHSSCIETVQQQQSVMDEVIRLMVRNNALHRVIGVKPHTEKMERDAGILLPYLQSRSIVFNTNLPELMNELKSFPRGKTVDIIDSLAMAVSIAVPAHGAEYESVRGAKIQLPRYSTNFYVL